MAKLILWNYLKWLKVDQYQKGNTTLRLDYNTVMDIFDYPIGK